MIEIGGRSGRGHCVVCLGGAEEAGGGDGGD